MSVRAVTDDEVAFYRESGWVRMPGLVDSATVAAMLNQAQKSMADAKAFAKYGNAVDRAFLDFPGVDRTGPVGCEMLLAPAMGRNMVRLLDVQRVRVLTDGYLVKLPQRDGLHAETLYHQDFPGHPVDRSGFLTVWLALHDLPADAGMVRFYSRSHTQGVHGWVFADSVDLRERCPDLKDDDLSPPLAMKAGDATAHHSLTVHGTLPNVSSQQRWAHTVIYMDSDTRYTGAQGLFPEGLRAKPFTVLDQAPFPLVPMN